MSAYDATIAQAANQYGIPPALLSSLINVESAFNPNAVSSAGAAGLTQLMPATAANLGGSNPFDPTQSIYGGAQALAQDYQATGNWTDALRYYNGGTNWPSIPSTQDYASKVLSGAGDTSAMGGSDPLTGAFANALGTAIPGAAGLGSANPLTGWVKDLQTWIAQSTAGLVLVVIGLILVVGAVYMFARNEGLVPETIPIPVPV